MALGLFRHIPAATLVTLHSEATAALLAGKNRIVTTAGSGDVNVTKEWQIDNKVFWEELNWALEQTSPAGYPPKVRRTVIKYV